MSIPPPYAPPSIGPAGLTVPSYQSILADNLNAFLNIYGPNQYIAPDSAIYQLLSIISLKQSDTMLAVQLAYNQSSPQTAVGAGLDRQVKMNGLAREPFSFSTALLTLVGTNGTVINNGIAQDQQGNLWALPSTVTIVSGTITVTAVCTTPGAITAEPGTIDIINTPVAGWATVNNSSAAIAGLPVEPDSALRARQSISVALPSVTPLASTIAAVLALDSVIRVAPGYPTPGGPGSSIENPTGAIDSPWGNPPHSISIVAQCTDTQAVANAVYAKKTIGCFTNGTTTVPVVDSVTGVTEDISFYQPTNLPVYILVVLVGYGSTPTTAAINAVQAALVTYLNELAIGETVSIGALYFEVMSVNNNITAPNFGTQSLQLGLATATTTGTFSSAASSMVVASATGIVSGQLVVGAGIAPGTLVAGAPSGTTVNLSKPTTAAGSAAPVAFSTLGSVDIPMPNFYYAAQGVAPNVSVVAA